MTHKNAIIHTGGNAELSAAVQRVLFGLGYRWESGFRDVQNARHPVVITTSDGLFRSFAFNTPYDAAHTSFEAATQFGELLEFLTKEEAEPNIMRFEGSAMKAIIGPGRLVQLQTMGACVTIGADQLEVINARVNPAKGPDWRQIASDIRTAFRNLTVSDVEKCVAVFEAAEKAEATK